MKSRSKNTITLKKRKASFHSCIFKTAKNSRVALGVLLGFHFKLSWGEETGGEEQVYNYMKVAKLNFQITQYHNVPQEQ